MKKIFTLFLLVVSGMTFAFSQCVYPAPFTENFDTLALTSPYTALPTCWDVQAGPDFWDVTNDVTNGPGFLPNIGDHTTGSSNFMWIDASTDILGNEMVTPEIDMTSLTVPYVGFWFASDNITNATNHTISLDAWDGSAWVNLTTLSGNFPGWVEIAAIVPGSIPDTAKFRIQALPDPTTVGNGSLYFQNDLGVDDFFLVEAPSCPPPTSLAATAVESFNADLYWNSATATSWIIELGAPGFVPGSGTDSVQVVAGMDSMTVAGLMPETNYDAYVREFCGAGDSSVWIGPVSFLTLPSCPAPINVVTNLPSADSAVLSWTQLAAGTMWEVEFGVAPLTQTGVATDAGLTATTLSLGGLIPQTSYEYYVRTVCGAGDTSLWTGPLSFTTPCAPYIAPYTESFDAATFDPCASLSAVSGGPWNLAAGFWNTACPAPSDHTGNGGNFIANDMSTPDAGVVFQMNDVDVSALTVPYLDMYHYMCGPYFNEVYVEAWDGTTWASVGLINTSSPVWENYGYVLTGFTFGANLVRLRFRLEEGTGGTGSQFQSDVALDDISVIEAPTCFVPANLASANVMDTSADVSWLETFTATMWEVQYGPAGFALGTGTSIYPSGTPDTTLVGLMDLTTYDFYVRSICGPGDSSLWSAPSSFTTELIALTCAPGTGAPFYVYEESFENNACTGVGALDLNGIGGFTNSSATTAANWELDCGLATGSGWIDAGAFDGDAYLYLETTGTTNAADTLTSSAFDISTLVGSARFTAYYLNGGTSTLTVQRSDDGGPWTTVFVNVGLGGTATPDLGEWTIMADDISAQLGTVSSIAYRFIGVPTGNNTGDIGLDLFQLETCVSCVPPSAISATVISADSAQLDFTPFGPATNVIYEYGVSGFALGTGTMGTTTADSVLLTGLTPATVYEYYIGSDCSGSTGDSSILDGPYTFTTPCATFVAPYFQNFDALSLVTPFTAMPICWQPQAGVVDFWDVTNGTTNSPQYLPGVVDHTTGSSNFMWIDASTNITANEMISADIDISALTVPLAGFWYASNNVTNTISHTISLDAWDGAAWVNLTTYQGNSASWVEVSAVVPPSIPSVTRFRISATGDPLGTTADYFQNDLGVDDFFVVEQPTCPAPVGLATAGIGSDTAVFTWTETGSATLWDVEFGLAGFTPTGVPTVAGITDTFYVATGLMDNADYSYYVRSSCSAIDSSFWVGPFNFTTECATFIPAYATGFNPLVPACWEMAGAGTPVTGPSGFGASNWQLRAQSFPAGAAGINFFTTGKEEWLLSPNFDLTSGGWSVEMEVRVTDWLSANADPLGMDATDDEVQLLFTEDGIVWNVINTWNAANNPGVTGETVNFVIPSVAPSVRFAIWGTEGTVDDAADYDFLVNAFNIIPTPQNEIGVTDISSPVSGCGVESTPITITVENFAAATLYYVPVVVELTGDITDVFTVILDTFPAFSTTTLTLDSINTLAGGMVNVNAFTNLANDEDPSNDTMMVMLNFGEIPPAVVIADVMSCEGDEVVLTAANLGQLNWYTSDTATTAAFVGDTMMFTAMSDTGFYVSQQETFSDTLTLDMFDSFGDGWNGASLNIFVNGVPTAGSPYTIATGSTGTAQFYVEHNDLISFLYTSGAFAAEPAYNIVTSAGEIIFNDGGGFTSGVNTIPVGGFNQNIQLAGCPSELVFVEVSVGQHTLDSITMAACDSMMIAGVNVTTSGSYTDSLMSMGGCDSIVVYDLTINNSSASAEQVKLCTGESITLADGTVVTAGGTYTATVPNAAGCDSVITYDVVEGTSSSFTQNVQLCAGDTLMVGSSMYTMSGTYMDTLGNADGCDSVVTSNLVVLPLTDVTIGGVTTICDNAGVIDLTLDPVGGTLAGPGVTASSFDPAVAGVGAHTLTYTFTDGNGCDAMASLDLEVVVCTGIDNIEGIETISIYPNPYVSTINVMFDDATSSELTIKLFDVTGRVLLSETVNTTIGTNNIALEVPTEAAAGVTMMQIERDGAIYSATLIKK